jgi:protein O-GlcNAc transferase
LRETGKLDEAVTACREAIRMTPDVAETHTNLGVALAEQGNLGEAVAEFREAIRLQPEGALVQVSHILRALRDLPSRQFRAAR